MSNIVFFFLAHSVSSTSYCLPSIISIIINFFFSFISLAFFLFNFQTPHNTHHDHSFNFLSSTHSHSKPSHRQPWDFLSYFILFFIIIFFFFKSFSTSRCKIYIFIYFFFGLDLLKKNSEFLTFTINLPIFINFQIFWIKKIK